jgi:enamine deaminase RidA (YjgF/YER057c/UK114 family)
VRSLIGRVERLALTRQGEPVGVGRRRKRRSNADSTRTVASAPARLPRGSKRPLHQAGGKHAAPDRQSVDMAGSARLRPGQRDQRHERVLVCAGQTSVDADGQPLHEGDMGAQVGQALDNLEAVLGEAGFALADVVRMNYFVTDVDAFFQAGEIYGARLAKAGCKPTS